MLVVVRPALAAIVCAYNEAPVLSTCLHSLLTQTRPPDEVLVINNASSDETGAVARAVPGVRVVDEPAKGLVVARETARQRASGDILAKVKNQHNFDFGPVSVVGSMWEVEWVRIADPAATTDVEGKLKALDDIYRFAVEQSAMSRGQFLELTIMLILVLELVLFSMGVMR